MYTRILVPVDGSLFAEQLVAPASKVAQATGAELALLRVVESDDEQDFAKNYVEALAAPLGATTLCLRAGKDGVAAAIRDEAKRVGGTLVAICSQARSGVMQALFGSVALQVLRELGEPLVAFCPHPDGPAALSKVAQVVLPLDGSALSESIAPHAAMLAKWLGARLVVVSVVEPQAPLDANVMSGDVQESGYVRSKANELAGRYGVPVTWEVLHGEPKEAIPRFVRSLGDAMLAMSTHGRSGLRAVMAGSVTAQCLRDSQVPVYIRLP